MRIALCQMNIKWEDKESNLMKAERFIEEASGQSASFVCFPEMSLTGFSMNIAKTGETDRNTVRRILHLAKKYNIAIGIGWVALNGEKGENHYTIVDQHGNELSDYTELYP